MNIGTLLKAMACKVVVASILCAFAGTAMAVPLRVCVWDADIEDDDRIMVKFGNEVLFGDVTLKEIPWVQCADRSPSSGIYELSVKALNTGESGLNTAAISVAVGNRTENRFWNLDKGEPKTWLVNISNDGAIFPRLVLSESALTIDEGGRGTYTARLASRPNGPVIVTLGSTNSEVTLSSVSLSFSTNNWDEPRTVTVTARRDDDAIDDTSILTHSINGVELGGRTVVVTVKDDDIPSVRLSESALTIDEGGSGTYTVVLTSSHGSEGHGVVAVRPMSENDDVAVTPEVLTFTATNWSTPQTVTVRAEIDDDIIDDTSTVTHKVSGYGEVMSADRVIVSVRDTATIPDAPRNLMATAGDGQVTLSWLAPLSNGGTHIIGYDYQVDPKVDGDDRGWIPTGGNDTSHDVTGLTNGVRYTFAVRALNAVTAQSPGPESTSARVSATPQVGPEGKNAVTDTLQAVAAATAANITANIGTRFAAARGGSAVVIGGQEVNFGPVPTEASLSTATNPYLTPFTERTHLVHGRSFGFDELLRLSAFEIALSAAGDEAHSGIQAPQWTVWGRGDLQYFESLPERGATYDGDLKAGYLGVDARLGDRWLAGLATSLTRAEADYDPGDDSSGGDGVLGIRMRGVHPYLRYAPDAKSDFWTILGAGRGEIENERAADGTRETSDITMWMGAAGARRSLVSVEALDLALLGDVGFARVETEDGLQAIHGLTVDSWRARLGVEGSHTASLASGATLTSFVEVAGRYDGGDGDDEVGLEVSPGLYISDPSTRFGLEVRGRVLALHSAENYKERGVSMTASLSPGSGGVGLSLSLSPRWGANTEEADTLWRDATFERLESGAAQHHAMSFDARVGYGVRAMSGLLTPFGEFSLRDQDSRQMRIGTRFNRQHSGLGTLSLELSGERRESSVNDPEHRVGVIGRLRF